MLVPRFNSFDKLALLAAALLCLATACSPSGSKASNLDPAVEKRLLDLARLTVSQKEDWVDRAEFQIERHGDEWRVTAWRVDHPEATGKQRYVPWGFRIVVIDDHDRVVDYVSKR